MVVAYAPDMKFCMQNYRPIVLETQCRPLCYGIQCMKHTHYNDGNNDIHTNN